MSTVSCYFSLVMLLLCVVNGQAEKVKMRFSVHNNEHGYMNSLFVDNAPSKMMRNLNLEVDVDAFTDESEELKCVRGSVRGTPLKPCDYEYFEGVGYYKFHHDEKLTFKEALSVCAREGGHLAIINSIQESRVLKRIYERHSASGGPWSYIGFYDRSKASVAPEYLRDFVTIFGQQLNETGFSIWNPSNPNNYGGIEWCGCVLQDGLLGDIGCDDRLSFFCEYDLSMDEASRM